MDSFMIYTEPFVLTGGGPGNSTTFLSQALTQMAIGQFDIGPAAAFSLPRPGSPRSSLHSRRMGGAVRENEKSTIKNRENWDKIDENKVPMKIWDQWNI